VDRQPLGPEACCTSRFSRYEQSGLVNSSTSPHVWDAIFTVPKSHDIARWKAFDEVYVPGRGRPREIHMDSHCGFDSAIAWCGVWK
jgi:hypothetical protein